MEGNRGLWGIILSHYVSDLGATVGISSEDKQHLSETITEASAVHTLVYEEAWNGLSSKVLPKIWTRQRYDYSLALKPFS